jgi:transposase InsO family protein
LERQGEFISRRRVIRLMKEINLICKTKRKFKATIDSNYKSPVAPNLLNRQFNVDKPNCYYVGDITYVATNEGVIIINCY